MQISRMLIMSKFGKLTISNSKSRGKERLIYEGLFNLLKLRKLKIVFFWLKR